MISSLILMVLPTAVARLLLPGLRRAIAPDARVGFSFVRVGTLRMGSRARIGHLNFVRLQSLEMDAESRIGHLNRLEGSFGVALASRAAIGNRNKAIRLVSGLGEGTALSLGEWAKITSDHLVDLTCSVTVGAYSTIAGSGSQIWTHGYVHAEKGLDRYRIDGPVVIEDNVYIGSMSFVSMGVRIATGVIVGGGTSVAKDLAESGFYMSAPIRRAERPSDPESRSDLLRDESDRSGDIVYRKIAKKK